MKSLTLLLVLFLCAFSAYAENSQKTVMGDSACSLFDTLGVEQVPQPADGAINTTYEKELSGLYCTSYEITNPTKRRICDCTFSENLTEDQKQDIYFSIGSEERFIGGTDVRTYNKMVGTMFFNRIVYKLNDDEYLTKYQFTVLFE